MQTFDYIFNIGGNYSATIKGITEATGNFSAKVESANNLVGKLSSTLAVIDLGRNAIEKINNVFSGITEAGSAAELQLMNLKTLFGGNAEAAEAMYERISEYGKVTPYDKAGLIEAQRTMMSFGIEGEKAFETLKQIGDIAMGDSGKMQSLALAFAQMSSTGKLTGQDLMQMVNAGFNPLQEISKQTGKSVADLKKDMEKGGISVGMVESAFQSATSEGGLFHNAIAEASETTAGKMASIQDTIEEIKVSIFNVTGNFGLWVSTLTQVMVPISELMPLIMGVGKAMSWVKNLQWASMWSGIKGFLYASRIQMLMMNRELITGQFASNGFLINITRATLAVVRFATVGVFQALKGLGALLLSFVTTGATSVKFAGIASTSFATFKTSAVTACRAVGVAIKNIPIIGWVVAAIAALAAVGIYFWNTSAKFRAVLKGLWASFKVVFTGIGDMAKQVFGGIGDLIKAAFSLDGKGIDAALSKLKKGFTDYGSQVEQAFRTAYNEEMAAAKAEEKKEDKPDTPKDVPCPCGSGLMFKQCCGKPQEVPEPETPNPTGETLGTVASGGTSSEGGKVRNVTVNVEKLVERFEIHTTNLQGDISHVKDMISEVLLSALNDVNLAM